MAVAMWTVDKGQVTFAGFILYPDAVPSCPFMSASSAEQVLRDAGYAIVGTAPELVWVWSSEDPSPFFPSWQFDSTAGRVYVGQDGEIIQSFHAGGI